jgi:hypothetical protein
VRALAAVAALLASGGCIGYDHLPAPAEPGIPTQLTVSLTTGFPEQVPGAVEVLAFFYAGRDAAGRRRRVVDDILWVRSTAVPPQPSSQEGIQGYAGTVPPAADGWITVRPPRVAGAGGNPGEIRLHPLQRAAGADSVVAIPAAGDLLLRFVPPRAEPDQGEEEWSLFLHAEGERLSVQGAGPLPVPLRVPRELLPGRGAAAVQLRLSSRVVVDHTTVGDAGEYRVRVWTESELRWWAEPAGAP